MISLWIVIGSSRLTDREQGIEFNRQDNSVGLIQFAGFSNTGLFWHTWGKRGSTAMLKSYNSYRIVAMLVTTNPKIS